MSAQSAVVCVAPAPARADAPRDAVFVPTEDAAPATVLTAVLDRLVAGPDAAVVLLSGAVADATATAFFAQCAGPAPRPRPTASVRMEPAVLVHGFARRADWAGRLVCLSGREQRVVGAALLARRFSGAAPGVVAELRPVGDGWLALGVTVSRDGDCQRSGRSPRLG